MTYDPNQGNYGPPPGGYGPPAGPPGGYPPPPGFGQGPGGSGSTFFGSLFDFNFTSFATPTVIKVLYILGTVLLGLGYLFVVITAFSQGAMLGVLAVVGGALVALVYLIFLRVTLEFYYAVVRMSEDIHQGRR